MNTEELLAELQTSLKSRDRAVDALIDLQDAIRRMAELRPIAKVYEAAVIARFPDAPPQAVAFCRGRCEIFHVPVLTPFIVEGGLGALARFIASCPAVPYRSPRPA